MHKTKYIAAATGIALFLGAATLAQAATLTSGQISAIVNLLQAFGADSSIIANVEAQLTGQANAPADKLCADYSFLNKSDTDATTNGEVSKLQVFLGISPTTGYYGVHTSIAYFNKCESDNSQPTSVAGMSQYTDSNFGFSFWYPSGWTVTQVPVSSVTSYGTTPEKRLLVSSPGQQKEFYVDEVYAPNGIVEMSSGCPILTDYFSNASGQWMETTSCTGATSLTQAVNFPLPGSNTMGGLHILRGEFVDGTINMNVEQTIVPLSASNFVSIFGEKDSIPGETDISSEIVLTRTIVATDPTVAIPVSTAQQIATIQAEASAYGVSSNNQTNVFLATPTSGTAPLTVDFTAPQSSGGGKVDFGDGNSSSVVSIAEGSPQTDLYFNHIYNSPGTYFATITNSFGVTLGTVTITVTSGQ